MTVYIVRIFVHLSWSPGITYTVASQGTFYPPTSSVTQRHSLTTWSVTEQLLFTSHIPARKKIYTQLGNFVL